MAYYDFPHTRNYDTDLGYLIKRYFELSTDFESLEKNFNDLKAWCIAQLNSEALKTLVANKLDEWLQDGTLEALINNPLNHVTTYDTIVEMLTHSGLLEGSKIYCSGADTVNDGNGGHFRIRARLSTDTIDNYNLYLIDGGIKVAERIIEKSGYVTPEMFGAKGDGVTDDSMAFQKCFDYASENKIFVYVPKATNFYGIKKGLEIKVGCAGVEFEYYSYTGEIRPLNEIDVILKIHPSMGFYLKNCTIGSENRINANGILFVGHVGLNIFEHCRVYNLNGYGMKFNAIWDSVLTDISVELCGNENEYAFSFNDDGDTCNMTNINRLQVEQSDYKAIYISPNTLCCHITNIHSERTTNAANRCWFLGGNRCEYNVVRLHKTDDTETLCTRLSGAKTNYSNMIAEGNIVTEFEGYGGSPIIVNNSIFNKLIEIDNQLLKNDIQSCNINELKISISKATNCIIETVKMKWVSGYVDTLFNCDIGTLTNESTQAIYGVHGCIISNLNADNVREISLDNCTINGLKNGKFNYTSLSATNTTFNCNINIDFTTTRLKGCIVNGNINRVAGNALVCLTHTSVTGTVTNCDMPLSNGVNGEIHYNLNYNGENTFCWVFNGTRWIGLQVIK